MIEPTIIHNEAPRRRPFRVAEVEPHSFAGITYRATDWEYVAPICRCGWIGYPVADVIRAKLQHHDHYRKEYWWRFTRPSDEAGQAIRDADPECNFVRPSWGNAAAFLGMRPNRRYRDADIDWDGQPDTDGRGVRGSGGHRGRRGTLYTL